MSTGAWKATVRNVCFVAVVCLFVSVVCIFFPHENGPIAAESCWAS